MFQKDVTTYLFKDIIANYMTFLQKCPNSVFEQETAPINIEHPDLV